MGIHRGPNNVKDGLVFGYDTNYGVADNDTTTRFYKGKPSTRINSDALNSEFSNGTTRTQSSWGGTTGSGVFSTDTNPSSLPGSLMYANSNTSVSGTGGTYTDIPSTRYTLTNGRTYTRSWYMKGSSTASISGHICSSNRYSDNTYIVGPAVTVTPVWQRFHYTFTYSGPTSTDWQLRHINYTNGLTVYISSVQLEESTIETPFTLDDRSDTDSLIDLKKTLDIDVSTVSFDSTGQPTFDGTDDFINLGSSGTLGIDRNISVFAVVKLDSVSGWHGIFGNSSGGTFVHFQVASGGTLNCYLYGPSVAAVSSASITAGTWVALGFTFDGSTLKLFQNGVQIQSTATSSTASITSASNVGVGKVYSTARFLDGIISVLKVYNKPLTQAEVTQDFNNIKGRFNI